MSCQVRMHLALSVLAVSAVVLLAGCTISSRVPSILPSELEAEAKSQLDLAEQTLRNNTQLVADLAWPIVANNTPHCRNLVEYRNGIWIAHEERVPNSLLGMRSDSTATVGKQSEIWGIAKGSPAGNSPLQVGDRIVGIGDQEVANSRQARKLMRKSLAQSDGNPIKIVVARDSESIEVELESVLTCRSNIRVSSNSSINATANGKTITINNGLIVFADNPEEVQFVIGHELAHNIASHVPKARAGAGIGLIFDIALAGYGRVWAGGVFSYFGVRAMSKRYEREADYLAMYYLANAKVDLDGIESFWRRMASMDIRRTGYTLTHPATPERFIMMKKTREEIEAKRAKGHALVPETKRQKTDDGTK